MDYFLSLYARPLTAALVLAAYLGYVYFAYRRAHALPKLSGSAAPEVLVIYASQTGQAEAIARQSASAMSGAGHHAAVLPLHQFDVQQLDGLRQLFFVLSTYGEGQAPEHAQRLAKQLLSQRPSKLKGLAYGLLALGDSHYPDFCAFGRALNNWLGACGAQPSFAPIEVDRLDAGQLQAWQQALFNSGWLARIEPDTPHIKPHYLAWQFAARQCLNPGSPGAPLCSVQLKPPDGHAQRWQAGDLVEVLPPNGDGPARRYSIANLAGDNAVELIVRSHLRADGRPGQVSHWLNQTATTGSAIALRIISNPGFHQPAEARPPLILIGAGSGLAGLMGHMRARAQAPIVTTPATRNMWLIFGERSTQYDRPYQAEINRWHVLGVLSRLNLCFSREQSKTRYVQHALLAQADALRDWISAGAHLMICGHAKTMAPSVDAALYEILGADQVETLIEAGRVHRDVF